ncbi:MAG: endolytic transglycosylase MltG [Butyricicoccus sp.]
MSYSEQKPRNRHPILGTLLYLVLILMVSGILASSAIVLSNDLFALAKPDKEITVTVPEDATVKEVSELLGDSDVVNYAWFFRTFVTFAYRDVRFNPGEYTLNSSMDYREILSTIRISPYTSVKVTIPEGYTVEQIKSTILEAGLSDEKELTKALKKGEFEYDFLPEDLGSEENRLEGYLFPDTYEFYISDDAESILKKMLDNFEKKITDDSKRKSIVSVCEKNDITVRDALIIASMIEKEAASNEEMRDISGVIFNRLNDTTNFPYLNIDATLQYVCGHSGALTEEDLKMDSPYNTYTNRGLPPGPICNPGYAALYAAVHPNEHDYYYYVANANGSAHIFTSTLEEHNAAVAQVEKEKQAKEGD